MARRKSHKKGTKRRRKVGGVSSGAKNFIMQSLGVALGDIAAAYVDKGVESFSSQLGGAGKYAGSGAKLGLGFFLYKKGGSNPLIHGAALGLSGNGVSGVIKPALHLAGIPVLGTDTVTIGEIGAYNDVLSGEEMGSEDANLGML